MKRFLVLGLLGFLATSAYADLRNPPIGAIIASTNTWSANQTFSSATVNTLNFSTITVVGNQGYILLYSSTAWDNSGSSATTLATYIPTNTTITVTPKRTTSRIEISVTGALNTGAGSTANALVSLFRGSTNLVPGSGDLCIADAAVAGAARSTCSGDIIDLPNTTSATTYTVYLRNDSAGNSVTWNTVTGSLKAAITIKEWGY